MAEILRTYKVNKYFTEPEKFHVIKDIDMSINTSEFVSIVGKSGCGKSTLLYLLSTLDTNCEGKIEINNTVVTGMSQNDLAKFRNENIGFIFQFHFLLPEFTALENVMMPALKRGKYSKEDIEHMAIEKLGQVQMKDFAMKPSGKLSGGQQQRVAVARALINNPKIIMADEPTGNLDSINTGLVFDIFKEIAANGNTIIAVTHDNDFAGKSDRIIEMKDGQIVK
ncbi:MAG: ABC transporter ATP-binding protein [Flavobacteriales bacterium]